MEYVISIYIVFLWKWFYNDIYDDIYISFYYFIKDFMLLVVVKLFDKIILVLYFCELC